MNAPHRDPQAPANAGATNHQRVDTVRHAIVDQGISVQASANTMCAVEYMKSRNVGAETIERVLLHPEQRRRREI